jgi:thiol-disulfide isomerase/thioredoxin
MKRILLLIPAWLIFNAVSAQNVKVIDFSRLEQELSGKSDSVKVINFWASWCKPCIEELPHFDKVQEKLKDLKYSFVYVSLDFEDKKERAAQILKAKTLDGTFYLLKGDANEWINKINPEWQGDIPYTLLVYPGGKKKHGPQSFKSEEDLLTFIKSN